MKIKIYQVSSETQNHSSIASVFNFSSCHNQRATVCLEYFREYIRIAWEDLSGDDFLVDRDFRLLIYSGVVRDIV